MCGIVGQLGGRPPAPERVSLALRRLSARGPDHQQAIGVNHAGAPHGLLGATRLALVDLAPRSNQPFVEGPFTLVFNGEIYNHQDLRQELETLGERFHTTGDTEVLQKVLARWGSAGLARCDGMWAFAFHDERTGETLLGRDRFGEKPLFTWRPHNTDGLLFASEVPALAALAGHWPEADVEHVLRSVVNGYRSLFKDRRRGYFRDVLEVLPGHVLRLDACGRVLDERPFWSLPDFTPRTDFAFEDAVEEGRALVVEAVRSRLRGDVPAMILLSGGIDSNTLVGIARKELGLAPATITVADLGEAYDERTMVETTIADLDLDHHWVDIDRSNFAANLREMVAYNCAPIATVTYYAHGMMLKQVQELGRRLVLSGVGADEMFSGYYDHHNALLADLAGSPARHAAASAAWEQKTRALLRNPTIRDPDLYRHADAGILHQLLFHPDTASAPYLRRPWREPFAQATFGSGSILRERMLNELFHESVPVILREEDQSAMRRSVENRAPYLSPDLLAFSASLPGEFLIRNGVAKALLREIGRPFAPAAVIDRVEKIGFNAKLRIMLEQDSAGVRDLLAGDGPLDEWFDMDAVRQDSTSDSSAMDQRVLWGILNAKAFLDTASERRATS